MSFKVPSQDSVTAQGFVKTGAWDAREITNLVVGEFEEQFEVYDEEPDSYWAGDVFKVTITVEKL